MVCLERIPVVCKKSDIDNNLCKDETEIEEVSKPIMVHAVELPPRACKVKTVRFAEPIDPCERQRLDLCNFKHQDLPCECTHYRK